MTINTIFKKYTYNNYIKPVPQYKHFLHKVHLTTSTDSDLTNDVQCPLSPSAARVPLFVSEDISGVYCGANLQQMGLQVSFFWQIGWKKLLTSPLQDIICCLCAYRLFVSSDPQGKGATVDARALIGLFISWTEQLDWRGGGILR